MGSARLRRKVRDWVVSGQEDRVRALAPVEAARALLSLLPEADEHLKWRAVELFGEAMGRLVRQEPESAREIMRRLLWAMNEESGAVPWGVGEAMGEAMAHSELLAKEYLRLVASFLDPEGNYLEFGPLQRAVAWALGRAGRQWPVVAGQAGVGQILVGLLSSPDPDTRATAVWALGEIGDKSWTEAIRRLLDDSVHALVHGPPPRRETTVAELAREVVGKLLS